MKMILMIIAVCSCALKAQVDTFPVTFDYAVNFEVTYDQKGFCTCDQVTVSKDSIGYDWYRKEWSNCKYLDSGKKVILNSNIWVTKGKEQFIPKGWTRGQKIKYGAIGGLILDRSRGNWVTDTIPVLMTYMNENRKLIVDAPGDAVCRARITSAYGPNLETGTSKKYTNCTWISYEFGELGKSVRMLAVDGLNVAGEFRPD